MELKSLESTPSRDWISKSIITRTIPNTCPNSTRFNPGPKVPISKIIESQYKLSQKTDIKNSKKETSKMQTRKSLGSSRRSMWPLVNSTQLILKPADFIDQPPKRIAFPNFSKNQFWKRTKDSMKRLEKWDLTTQPRDTWTRMRGNKNLFRTFLKMEEGTLRPKVESNLPSRLIKFL